MPKSAKELPELTPKQKEIVAKNWKMDRRELVCKVFENPKLTLRHVEAKSVDRELATLGLSGTVELQVVGAVVTLKPEQLEYIENNHKNASPLELTRAAFADDSLTLTSPEGRAVIAHLKIVAPELFDRNDEPVREKEYRPPRNLTEMVNRINALVPNPEGIGKDLYNAKELTSQEKKSLNLLLACVNVPRFIHQASQYLRKVDRELFESSFLRHIHDAQDLTTPDIDQYMAYCSSIVSAAQLERIIQRFQAQADEGFDRGGKVTMSEVDQLRVLTQNLQDEKKRQEALYKTLSGARSTRINELTLASASMHPLVAAWRSKEKRDRHINIANSKRSELVTQIQTLTDAEMMRAEVWGLSPESIIK